MTRPDIERIRRAAAGRGDRPGPGTRVRSPEAPLRDHIRRHLPALMLAAWTVGASIALLVVGS